MYGSSSSEGDPLFEFEQLEGKPRDAVNWVTPLIDGSMIYGSSETINKVLRAGAGGRMYDTFLAIRVFYKLVLHHTIVGPYYDNINHISGVIFYRNAFPTTFPSVYGSFSYQACFHIRIS